MGTGRWILLALAVALAAAAVWVLRSPVDALNALIVPGGHTLEPGVAYGPLPRQRLDIYRPTTPTPPGGWPVAVFFPGGSWNRGERADYRFVGDALASRGVLTLVVDYRLYPEVRYPTFLADSAAAVAFGIDQAQRLGGNPRRVFVVGHSAGAYNAAMLALDPRWLAGAHRRPAELAGWVGLAGPYDFLPIRNPEVKPVFDDPRTPTDSQPIEHARGDAPAAWLGAARTDDLVQPQRNTVGLATRLTDAGGAVTLRLYDRVDHLTLVAAFALPLRWMAPVLDDVSGFVLGAPESGR